MPTFTATKTYQNGTILIETDLNNLWNSTSGFFNGTRLDSTNFQAGGLIGSNFADGTIGTPQLVTSAATTAVIADGAVTPAKLSVINSVFGANIAGNAFTGDGTLHTVTGVQLTVSGARPVLIAMRGYKSNPAIPTANIYFSGSLDTPSEIDIVGTGTSSLNYAALYDARVIGFGPTHVCSAQIFWAIDYPTVGNATYTLKVKPAYFSPSSRVVVTFYTQMYAIEL